MIANYKEALSHISVDLATSPESLPYYMDPRSPQTLFPEPASLESLSQYSEGSVPSTDMISGEFLLHQKIIGEILNDLKLDLDSESTWGFLSYMEYNQCVASTYIEEKEFLIDNSPNPMDSKSLGLASLSVSTQMSRAGRIRHQVHKGIILSSDDQGNIFIKNESKVPVIIKGFKEPENFCISEEVIRLKGTIMPGNEMVKVFDIEEFRSQIGLQIVKDYTDLDELRNRSLISICFGEAEPNLQSPCWILLANIIAFNMAGDEEVKTEVQEYIARMNLNNNNNQVQKEVLHSVTQIYFTHRQDSKKYYHSVSEWTWELYQ